MDHPSPRDSRRPPLRPVRAKRPTIASKLPSPRSASSSPGRRTATPSASTTASSPASTPTRATGSGVVARAGRASRPAARKSPPLLPREVARLRGVKWLGRNWRLIRPAWLVVVLLHLPGRETFDQFRRKRGWTQSVVRTYSESHQLPQATVPIVALTLGMTCSDFLRESYAHEAADTARRQARLQAGPHRSAPTGVKSRRGSPDASGRRQGPRETYDSRGARVFRGGVPVRVGTVRPDSRTSDALERWATEILRAHGELRPLRAKQKRRTRWSGRWG